MKYQTIENIEFSKYLLTALLNAHNPSIAKIRVDFFKKEYYYFQNNIINKTVFDAGCGLGHEAIELAKYNTKIHAVDINEYLIKYAKQNIKNNNITNVKLDVLDFMNPNIKSNSYDVSILNMGTISDFDNQIEIINQFLRISKEFYFDFYDPSLISILKRKEMYEQEGFYDIKIRCGALFTKKPFNFYSKSISKQELFNISKELNCKIEFTKLTDFATMAKVYG